jgi:hypothetical protein
MSNKKNTEEIYRNIMLKVLERLKEEYTFEFDETPDGLLEMIKYVKFIDIILDRDGKKK